MPNLPAVRVQAFTKSLSHLPLYWTSPTRDEQ